MVDECPITEDCPGCDREPGYVGLLTAAWVLGPGAIGPSCVSYPVISNTGEGQPAACVVNTAIALFSDVVSMLAVGLLTLFCAIPAVGALLVYGDYQRRRAGPFGPLLTHANWTKS